MADGFKAKANQKKKRKRKKQNLIFFVMRQVLEIDKAVRPHVYECVTVCVCVVFALLAATSQAHTPTHTLAHTHSAACYNNRGTKAAQPN